MNQEPFYEFEASLVSEEQYWSVADSLFSWQDRFLPRLGLETSQVIPNVMEGILYEEDGNPITTEELNTFTQWFSDHSLDYQITWVPAREEEQIGSAPPACKLRMNRTTSPSR